MKTYRVNVNGTNYEIQVEEISAAEVKSAPATAPAQAPAAAPAQAPVAATAPVAAPIENLIAVREAGVKGISTFLSLISS